MLVDRVDQTRGRLRWRSGFRALRQRRWQQQSGEYNREKGE